MNSWLKLPINKTALRLASVYLLISTLAACSAVIIDNDSPPEAQYAEGERLLNKERFIEAVERFRILKSRYPYSKYAALASLKIGDSHFQEEAYIEAASAYKIFRELYPKHEQAAYALERIGLCHYNLMPSTSDRDLEPATSAIEAYTQLIRDYPNSSRRNEAEKRIRELKGKLAEKEDYIANFYFKKEYYQAAAGRYSGLIESYPEFGYNEQSLYRLAFSYERLGEYKKSAEILDRLNSEHPNGKFASDSEALRKKIASTVQE
jgi:outer membrane protein assembly factor BamD